MTADPSILDPRVRAALDGAGITYETLACEAELADTAAFCSAYGIAADEACNTIIVALKGDPKRYVACLVSADSRLDVNHKVSKLVGVRRLSFAGADETLALTGMLIGGVTLPGLPPELPIYIDARILTRPSALLGGGNRTSKIRLAPQELLKLPNAQVEDIANLRE